MGRKRTRAAVEDEGLAAGRADDFDGVGEGATRPLVFTAGFVEDLRRRYESKPLSHRVDVFHTATSPDLAGLRAWVETVVSAVPEPGRAKLISRLRSDDHLVNTLNELAVGAALQAAGFAPLYERELEGGTPDWFVPATHGAPPLIVEVWNKNLPQAAVGRRRQWQELKQRVGKIQVGVVINVLPLERQGPPTTDVAKRILSGLRAWLGCDPVPGSEIVLPAAEKAKTEAPGYRFRISGMNPNGDCAILTVPGEGGAYTTADALKEIEIKIKKYAPTAAAMGAALVVVVAAEPGTPISKGTLRNIVEGKQSFEIVIDPHRQGEIADITLPMNAVDEPRTFSPAVSALGWAQLIVSDNHSQPPTIDLEFFANPARSIDPPAIISTG